MPYNNIKYRTFETNKDNFTKKITIVPGYYPLPPYLMVEDPYLGNRIIPNELCEVYLNFDSININKELKPAKKAFKDVQKEYNISKSGTPRITLQSLQNELSNLSQPLTILQNKSYAYLVTPEKPYAVDFAKFCCSNILIIFFKLKAQADNIALMLSPVLPSR